MPEQEPNVYAVLPAVQWRDYKPPPEPPAPVPGTSSGHHPLPSLLAQAEAEREAGGVLRDKGCTTKKSGRKPFPL